jgi:hypothetical protein
MGIKYLQTIQICGNKLNCTGPSAARNETPSLTPLPHIQSLHGIRIHFYSLRQVKVTFIPKPGKLDYTEAKAYRPISLSSFLLKTMEKLVDTHIKGGALRIHPLHRNQRAYQTGKSTDTALHNAVTRTEYATEHKNIALGTFLDIDEAFDRTSFDTIKLAAERHGIETAICSWICAMPNSGQISTILSGEP